MRAGFSYFNLYFATVKSKVNITLRT
jgi:hypothetical protein